MEPQKEKTKKMGQRQICEKIIVVNSPYVVKDTSQEINSHQMSSRTNEKTRMIYIWTLSSEVGENQRQRETL